MASPVPVKSTEDCTALGQLDKDVTCQICLEIYSTPKYLACNHAFCAKCIEMLPVKTTVPGLTIIACPTCRKETRVSEGGVRDLPPAFHVNKLVAVYGELESNGKRIKYAPLCPISRNGGNN